MTSRKNSKTESYMAKPDDFRSAKIENQIAQTKTAYLTVGMLKLTGYISEKEYYFLLDVILARFIKWERVSAERFFLMRIKHLSKEDLFNLERLKIKGIIHYESDGTRVKVWLSDLEKLLNNLDNKDREKYGE